MRVKNRKKMLVGVNCVKILAFDSSNQPLTVAVIDEEEILTEQIINVRRNHSIQLMPAIDEALKQANLTLAEIDRIAVAAGPGSYTGLRIAVTVAKSLAWARNIDLVGISSLQVLAGNSPSDSKKLLVPLFDARRENVYTGLYARDEKGGLIQLEADTHMAASEWAEFIAVNYPDKEVELIGSDAKVFQPVFTEKLGDRVSIAPVSQELPRASVLALLAREAAVEDTHHFIPTYLKLAEAEENWLKEHPDYKGGAFVETV